MPFLIHPFRRFPVQCAVTYNAGPFLKLPLAYFSVFGLLITLLVLSNGPAYAEWVAVVSSESAGGFTVCVDPDTIRQEEDGVEMWELYDYKTRRTKEGYSFLSFKKRIRLRRRTPSDSWGHALLWQYGKRYGGF
jgi:hypothetical protein